MNTTVNLEHKDAAKIASCIKNIVGCVSEDDIVEIVLKPQAIESGNGSKEKKKEKPEITMTSREVADVLGRTHTAVFKQIAKYLCEMKKEGKDIGFFLTTFVSSHKNKRSYPMYEMTESACKIYRNLVVEYGAGVRSVADGVKRFDRAMAERFHPEKKSGIKEIVDKGFLLEGRPRRDYEEYCNIFDQFIKGPAIEGREIAELTEKYQMFYEVMEEAQLKGADSNKIEDALFGVAIEAEMQGFIYGFKLFDSLLNKQLAVAI